MNCKSLYKIILRAQSVYLRKQRADIPCKADKCQSGRNQQGNQLEVKGIRFHELRLTEIAPAIAGIGADIELRHVWFDIQERCAIQHIHSFDLQNIIV